MDTHYSGGNLLCLVVVMTLYCAVPIHSAPTPYKTSEATQEPPEMKICQSCELYCMSKHNVVTDICNECQCEPPKELTIPNKHYCYFRKCEQECDKGYQTDSNGCPTCDCIA
ncbi:antistasin-like isoform X2 [Saccostrea echinata]|uniref:antistasin-like isoform X2 n=1 Tax=Saccostrea echinata TaxID=191078 RepID=UPI002A82C003|nr:antistasin-like isoform X2 [Saccostrea echinata]